MFLECCTLWYALSHGRLLVHGGSSDFRGDLPELARTISIKDFIFFGGFWGSKCPIFLAPPELPRPQGGTRSGATFARADLKMSEIWHGCSLPARRRLSEIPTVARRPSRGWSALPVWPFFEMLESTAPDCSKGSVLSKIGTY